jgi:hypothetical protein
MFRQALESTYPKIAGTDTKAIREQMNNPIDIGFTYFATADSRR